MQNTVSQAPATSAPKVLDVYGFVPSLLAQEAAAAALLRRRNPGMGRCVYAATATWPIRKSGPIPEAPDGETWSRVNAALINGSRGLLGNSSLTLLLWEQRGKRHPLHLPPFTEELILQWADAYFERNGVWPGAEFLAPSPKAPATHGSTCVAPSPKGCAACRGGLRFPNSWWRGAACAASAICHSCWKTTFCSGRTRTSNAWARGPTQPVTTSPSPKRPAKRGDRCAGPCLMGHAARRASRRWPCCSPRSAACRTSTACKRSAKT